jgi:hypothetical protein
MATTIGLVLVHGVGEQRRFDHLCAEVKSLVAALRTLPNVRVSVETRNTQDSEVGAPNETWRADASAPVKLHVTDSVAGWTVCLCIHEVWWADLDDKETLWNRFKFWLWGLGFWGVKKFGTATLPGAVAYMQPPRFPSFPWGGNMLREFVVRARLWAFANVFLLSALTVNLLNYLLRHFRLGQVPGAEVFYQFVGDVKLYQDRAKPGLGPLTDLGEPRRVAIRRRMVQALVDAYRANYDRWYVVAHSLGTVVAWNGLMETAHALPNYLSQETWNSLNVAGDPVIAVLPPAAVPPTTKMRPARPVWITASGTVLQRDVLFQKLRGLVTYGSPLDKFAYLWSQIVNINTDTAIWNKQFEWINVYEHSDPVSSSLAAYSGPLAPVGTPAPKNYAYKASPVLLLSHLKYLRLRLTRKGVAPDQFILRLIGWVLNGALPFPAPTAADSNWYTWKSPAFGLLLRTPWWLLGAAVFAVGLTFFGVPALLEVVRVVLSLPLVRALGWDAHVETAAMAFSALFWGWRIAWVLAGTAVTVTLSGIVRRILER